MITAVIAVSTMTSLAVRADDAPKSVQLAGKNYTFEEIAEMSHLNPDNLQNFFMENPEEFYQSLSELIYEASTTSSGSSTGTNCSSFSELYSEGTIGDILISGTNHSKLVIDYRHDHAAIRAVDGLVIHAPGPGLKSERTTLDGFGPTKKVRLYSVSDLTSLKKMRICSTAESNYIGWNYDIDASVSSKDTLNCATLVWRSFNDNGIKLKKYFYTCTPQTLVEDPQTICLANYNWSGDGNSFKI